MAEENLPDTNGNTPNDIPSKSLPEFEIEPQKTEPIEELSVTDAIAGVFTEPGDTFEGVKASPKKNYWILPIIILIVISITSAFLVTHDEELYSQIKGKQTKAAKERFDEAVKSGKMTQEKANEQMDQMDKGFNKSNPIFLVFTIAGPIVSTFIIFFFRGAVFFGVTKLFKGTAGFMSILSVLGLASIIDSIQTIIDTVLAIVMGKLQVNIGPVLLVNAESVGENIYKFLAHLDIFNFWFFAVIAIGLARVSNIKTTQMMPVVFGLWLLWVCITSFLKIPFMMG